VINNFFVYKLLLYNLLKVAYSFSRSFSTDTHREKTSVWRKSSKCFFS